MPGQPIGACEHRLDTGGLQDFALIRPIERRCKAYEIGSGADPAAVRIHRFEIPGAVRPWHLLAELRTDDGGPRLVIEIMRLVLGRFQSVPELGVRDAE